MMITKDSSVIEVLRKNPRSVMLFNDWGASEATSLNGLTRSVETTCALHDKPVDEALRELRATTPETQAVQQEDLP